MKKLIALLFIAIFNLPMFAQHPYIIPFKETAQLEFGAFQNASTENLFGISDNRSDFKPDIVGQKNVGLAFLMSLAVPGSGELYMGEKGQGLLFIGSEILIWTGLFINNSYADHLKDEYYTYATQHAGVQPGGKDRQCWIDIGKYNSIYDFNEQRRRDRFFAAIYDENEMNAWLWDTENNRLHYDGKRITAGGIASQDVYFYAAILLNHVISGINSMRLARQHNRKLIEETNWSIRFNSHSHNHNKFYGLSLTARF